MEAHSKEVNRERSSTKLPALPSPTLDRLRMMTISRGMALRPAWLYSDGAVESLGHETGTSTSRKHLIDPGEEAEVIEDSNTVSHVFQYSFSMLSSAEVTVSACLRQAERSFEA